MNDDQGCCHVEPVEKKVAEEVLARSQTAILSIGGMGCTRCAMRVRNSLLRLDGVVAADVLLSQGIAGVAYDASRLTPADLVEAVAHAGGDSHHEYAAEFIQHVSTAEAWALSQ